MNEVSIVFLKLGMLFSRQRCVSRATLGKGSVAIRSYAEGAVHWDWREVVCAVIEVAGGG